MQQQIIRHSPPDYEDTILITRAPSRAVRVLAVVTSDAATVRVRNIVILALALAALSALWYAGFAGHVIAAITIGLVWERTR